MRGPSPDGILGEAHRLAAFSAGRNSYTALFKAATVCAIPITLRGGALLELCKGKGVIHDCANSRDITIKDSATIDLSACWRNAILAPLEAFVGEFAFGGVGAAVPTS